MALRVVRDNHGHWRWTVSRPGMKPHLNGLRTTEAAAKREARRFAIKSAFESTQGEQQ